MKHLTLLALVLSACQTQRVAPTVPLDVEPPLQAACAERVWNLAWHEPDACTSCVDSVATCQAQYGAAYCAQACNACLGEDACLSPKNVNRAQAHLQATRAQASDVLWVGQGMADERMRCEAGHYLTRAENRDVIGNLHGHVWELSADEPCSPAWLDGPWVVRLCDTNIERYAADSGFAFPPVALPTALDNLTESRFPRHVRFDAAGKAFALKTNAGIAIYGLQAEPVRHDNAIAILRTANTWADRNVVFVDRIEMFRADQLDRTVTFPQPDYLERAAIKRRFARSYSDQNAVDLLTGELHALPNDEDARVNWWSDDEAIFTEFDKDKPFRQVAPNPTEYTRFVRDLGGPDTRSGSTLIPRWTVTCAEPLPQDRFHGALLNGRDQTGDVSFGVEWVRDGLRTESTRHGAIFWIAPVPNERSVWVGSADGLVQRWNFDTGKATRVELPYCFATGGGRAWGADGLVVRESRSCSADRFAHRVLLYRPDAEPKTITFNEGIVDAVMADDDTLVYTTLDAIVWWSVSQAKETRREPGPARFSEDGSTVVAFTAQGTFDTGPAKPARIMRTRGDGPDIDTSPVRACAINNNGTRVMCFEVKDRSAYGIFRFYDPVSGKLDSEFNGTLSGEVGALAPDGDGFLFGGFANTRFRTAVTFGGDDKEAGADKSFWGYLDDGSAILHDGEYLRLIR